LPHSFAEDDQTACERDHRAGETAVRDHDDTPEDKEQRSRNCGGGARREAVEHSGRL
jgi:hypothetical protein